MTTFPLDDYPGMNRFVRDWLHGDERFLKRGPLPGVSQTPLSAATYGSSAPAAFPASLASALSRIPSSVRARTAAHCALATKPRSFCSASAPAASHPTIAVISKSLSCIRALRTDPPRQFSRQSGRDL